MNCALYTYHITFLNDGEKIAEFCTALTAMHNGFEQDVIDLFNQVENQLPPQNWTHIEIQSPALMPERDHKKLLLFSKKDLIKLEKAAKKEQTQAAAKQQAFLNMMALQKPPTL
jgi:predicted metalloenzyme YecM